MIIRPYVLGRVFTSMGWLGGDVYAEYLENAGAGKAGNDKRGAPEVAPFVVLYGNYAL